MSTFVERLKSLYTKGFITELYLQSLVDSAKLTQEEYDYIIA